MTKLLCIAPDHNLFSIVWLGSRSFCRFFAAIYGGLIIRNLIVFWSRYPLGNQTISADLMNRLWALGLMKPMRLFSKCFFIFYLLQAATLLVKVFP